MHLADRLWIARVEVLDRGLKCVQVIRLSVAEANVLQGPVDYKGLYAVRGAVRRSAFARIKNP
jgi:hypothetical protein